MRLKTVSINRVIFEVFRVDSPSPAGLTISDVNGSSTSVYVGCFMNDHAAMVYKDLDLPNQYHATGSASALLANRVSWFYNLSGPSVSVNTACSGSLVALHLACQSIRTGETEMVSLPISARGA